MSGAWCAPGDVPPTRSAAALIWWHNCCPPVAVTSRPSAALELHPRTLQRRLRAAGTDFRGIVEGERRAFALRYLADPELPLVRIAGRLGCADQPTFTRACGNWFGVSPAVMRARRMAGEYTGGDGAR